MSDRPPVRITEVGPRDGLQNEPGVIPTADKVRLVELCAATGVDEVEVTSFVSPKWVPQLGDAGEVFALLHGKRPKGVEFSVLVPNEKGLDAALAVNQAQREKMIDKVSVFTAASETFSKKNTNATIEETLERFEPVIARAHGAGLKVRGYISCVIACPFEGPIDPKMVAHVAWTLAVAGVDEFDLGDTIGVATPETLHAMLEPTMIALRDERASPEITLHLHDTFNRAADCVKAALDLGIRSFDGSVAGLGGCPYASTPGKRAPGNISTETLVRTIHEAGYSTGVDLDKLSIAADFAREIVAKARGEASA